MIQSSEKLQELNHGIKSQKRRRERTPRGTASPQDQRPCPCSAQPSPSSPSPPPPPRRWRSSHLLGISISAMRQVPKVTEIHAARAAKSPSKEKRRKKKVIVCWSSWRFLSFFSTLFCFSSPLATANASAASFSCSRRCLFLSFLYSSALLSKAPPLFFECSFPKQCLCPESVWVKECFSARIQPFQRWNGRSERGDHSPVDRLVDHGRQADLRVAAYRLYT